MTHTKTPAAPPAPLAPPSDAERLDDVRRHLRRELARLGEVIASRAASVASIAARGGYADGALASDASSLECARAQVRALRLVAELVEEVSA
jgi:hypothetical protein